MCVTGVFEQVCVLRFPHQHTRPRHTPVLYSTCLAPAPDPPPPCLPCFMDEVSPSAGSSGALYPVPRPYSPAESFYNLLEGLGAPHTSPAPAPSKVESSSYPEGAVPMDYSSSPGLGYSDAGQEYPAAPASPNPLSLLSEVALGGGDSGPGSSEAGRGGGDTEMRRKRVHSAGPDGGHSKTQRSRAGWVAGGAGLHDDVSEDDDDLPSGPPLGSLRGGGGRRCIDDGPSAPDLQLDWVSSSDSDSDTDSCIEVISDAPRGRPPDLVDLTGESDGEVPPALTSLTPPAPAPAGPVTTSAGYSLSVILGRPVASTAQAGLCRGLHAPEVAGAGASCSCPRGPALGSIGLNASGAPATFSMEPHQTGAGACYGACLHPHHTPHHHHHHHHHHGNILFLEPARRPDQLYISSALSKKSIVGLFLITT